MNEVTMTTTATPAADLEDRVATALTSDATSSEELAALVNEVDIARVEVGEAVARARDVALSPTTPKDLRKPAREDLAAAEFLAERLGAAVAQLRSAQAAARRRETAQRRRTEQQALTAARDALAVELAERYPALAFELAELLGRCQACDDRIAEFVRVNRTHIDGVEVVARGLATAGLDSIQRLIPAVRLPSWDPKRQGMNVNIWPPAQQAGAVVPLGMQRHAAELGHEARKTGDAVGRMRAAEAGSPRRRIA